MITREAIYADVEPVHIRAFNEKLRKRIVYAGLVEVAPEMSTYTPSLRERLDAIEITIGRFLASPFAGKVALGMIGFSATLLTIAAINAVAISRGFS